MQACHHRFSNKRLSLHLFAFQEIDEQLSICENCFSVLNKFAGFAEQAMKAKEFFEYLRSLDSLPDDLESVRIDYGLRIEKVNQSTDTNDLGMNIKNEELDDDAECQQGEMSSSLSCTNISYMNLTHQMRAT